MLRFSVGRLKLALLESGRVLGWFFWRLRCEAYASGGVRDTVSDGENGILVAEGDIRALSGAIAHLLQDSGMRGEMGKRGRERVQSSIDIQTQSKRLEGIYINR